MTAPLEPSPPPLPSAATRPPAARRVALGLVLYGCFDLAMSIAMLVAVLTNTGNGTIRLNLFPGFVIYWVAAWLVWADKRVIWPLLAYLSALVLGGLIGSGLGFGLGLPARLTVAFARNEPFWFWFCSGYGLIVALFAGWLLVESLAARTLWPGGGVSPRSPWLQPRACLALGAVLTTAITWGVLALLQGSWTEPLVTRARGEYGDSYSYFPISYEFSSRNGHTSYQAVVLVYSETEFKTVPLQWAN